MIEQRRREEVQETTNEFAEELGELLRKRVEENELKKSQGVTATVVDIPDPELVLDDVTSFGEMAFVFNVDVIVPKALQQQSLKTFTLNALGESVASKRMLTDKK